MLQQSAESNPIRARLELAAVLLLMLAVAAVSWKLAERSELQVDPSRLASLPESIGAWRSVDVPLTEVVESALMADYNVQRAYIGPGDELLWLYVGYYGTRRGGRPEHTPRGCYTGAGWGIESSRVLSISGDEDLRANEYLVERHGEKQLVLYWYRSHRRTGMLGGLDQNLDRMIGLFRDGRADGALVRVSTTVVDDDFVTARSRLLSFASQLDAMLRDHWPAERPCDPESPDGCRTIEPAAVARG